MTTSTHHPRLRQAATVAAILAATLLLTELAFRATHALRPIWLFDDTAHAFRLAPGTNFYGFPINSDGFLDTETELPKPPGTFRILALFDSFGVGVVPYPKNVLTRLEKRLQRQHPSSEVINMGIARTGPSDYHYLLATEGMTLEPDLVLVGFFLGNDFFPSYGDGTRKPPYLLRFLRYALKIRPAFTGRTPNRQSYKDAAASLAPEEYAEILRRKSVVFRSDRAFLNEALPQVREPLVAIRDLCAAHGVDLVVLLLPDEVQVDPTARRAFVDAIPGYEPNAYDYTAPNEALAALLDDLGIDALDLHPTFWEAGKTETLYKPRDTHWNLRGNAVAAAVIEEYLLRRL